MLKLSLTSYNSYRIHTRCFRPPNPTDDNDGGGGGDDDSDVGGGGGCCASTADNDDKGRVCHDLTNNIITTI